VRFQKKSVEELYEEGLERLDRFDLDGAIRVGKELKKRRHSSAFEILGRAYQGKGEPDKAVEVLEEGVSLAPADSDLWEQLGCYYSDLERYDEAESALRRALESENDRRSAVLLNLAILYSRADRPEESLQLLDSLPPGEVNSLFVAVYKVDALTELLRFEEAITLADTSILLTEEEEDLDRPVTGRGAEAVSVLSMLGSLYAKRGRAVWLGRKDGEAALRDAWRALELDRRNPQAAWLVRGVENQISPDGKYYRILLEGRWHEPIEGSEAPPGFYVGYDVVADSELEALELIKRFEPAGVRDSLRIDKKEVLEARPDEPKGVYRANRGYSFFDE